MNIRAMARSVLVLTVVGTLVSAQQVSAESVFTPKGFDAVTAAEVGRIMAPESPASSPLAGRAGFGAFAADTVETFAVEIEEEKGPGMGKQLVIFAIITAVVGYAVIALLGSDDEPAEESTNTGKEPPFFPTGARLPSSVSR
jgi:hypothetical protein